ncbi:hypothetical protein [Sorangium cellulosum]|uniref:Uncharacterized protein n=1 Tax=Sorangium cellulosum So0157-2 TaxID=1254432 RepID=S4Y0K6_SORCE|nr:hypothetical protein [Sorangium cellulosum]AGP36438.1 hypothetical protein SCE1572_19250 [Sorangium cellulosum So0157-2]
MSRTTAKKTSTKQEAGQAARPAGEIPVLWPEELRAGLEVKRGRGAPPKARKVRASDFWASLCEGHLTTSTSWQWAPDRADEACRRLLQEAMAALREGTMIVDRATPELAGATRHVAVVSVDNMPRLIDFWAQARGVAFALRALFASWRFSIEMPSWPGPVWIARGFLSEERLDSDFRGSSSPALRMRALLAGADDATYAACLKEAASLREAAPFHMRAAVAVLFPEQTIWVDESCREALAIVDQPIWHRSVVLHLLACAADLDLALACAARMDPHTVATVADELAATFGPGIIDLLLRIFATDDWAYKEDRGLVAKVLSIFGTDRVAGAMMECLKSKGLREVGQAWCARFPDLARPELEKLAAKRSKMAPIAAEVLASLPARSPA